MSFSQSSHATIGAHSSNTPSLYSYNTTDSIADVIASGYFDNKKFQLEIGDIIIIFISGLLYRITITAISPAVTVSDTINGGDLNLIKDVNGIFRIQQTNTNSGAGLAAEYTFINDAGYYSTVGMGGSNAGSLFQNNTVFFGQGYNDTLYACAGNFSHKFYNDYLGRHSPLLSLQQLNMEIKPDGELSLPRGIIEHKVAWDDMTYGATRDKQGQSAKPDYDFTNLGLLFPQNDSEEAIFITDQFRHKMFVGTGAEIHPHIHWIQTGSALPVWKIDWRIHNNGDLEGSWTTDVSSIGEKYTWASGRLVQISFFPAIDVAGLDVSELFDFIVYRDDNVVSGDVLMKSFDFHYPIDTAGSRSEYTK